MSWTQVHVSGLPPTADHTDEELERILEQHFTLSRLDWAGEGTTIVKRDDANCCRGYCFLAFLTLTGATMAVDQINNDSDNDYSSLFSTATTNTNTTTIVLLQAQLSKPKIRNTTKKEHGPELRDLRIRRQRGQPVGKHPVLNSSNQSKLARSTHITR